MSTASGAYNAYRALTRVLETATDEERKREELKAKSIPL